MDEQGEEAELPELRESIGYRRAWEGSRCQVCTYLAGREQGVVMSQPLERVALTFLLLLEKLTALIIKFLKNYHN